MILRNQFECSSLRHVTMPMVTSFGLTELHTFNKIFGLTITPLLSPLWRKTWSYYHRHNECSRRVYLSNSGCSSSLDGKCSAPPPGERPRFAQVYLYDSTEKHYN